jgi:two-component system sensor kinase FixL
LDRFVDRYQENLPGLLSAIENASIDAIISIDRRGIVQTFNPAAETLFGYGRDEIAGQNVKVLMPGHFREQHDGYIANYLRTGEKKIIGIGRVVAGLRKDGSSFPMELSVGEATANGERVFVGFVRDLTQIESVNRRAETLQSELFQVSRLSEMGQIASNLAHEVSQPLIAIMNYSQAAQHMLSGDLPEAAPRVAPLLDKIEAQAQLATDIVKRLRNFIERREVECRPEDLRVLVEEALALAFVGFGKLGVRLNLDLTDARVKVDRVQIQQVLVNFTRNAAEAMAGDPHGEIVIKSERVEPSFIRVSVADGGGGVDPGIADRLFGPFVTTKPDGLGVGLSICKTIVENHGGAIGFHANEPRGSVFFFTLPVETAVQPVETAA